jgi:hypothetical protein
MINRRITDSPRRCGIFLPVTNEVLHPDADSREKLTGHVGFHPQTFPG